MEATITLSYGIGNAKIVNLKSVEGNENTVILTIPGESFQKTFVTPVTIRDIVELEQLKALLGYDKVTARVRGVQVDMDTEITSGNVTIILENVQSTKN